MRRKKRAGKNCFWFWLMLSGWVCCTVSCSGGKVESITNADPTKIRESETVTVAPNDWPWWAGPNHDFLSTVTRERESLEYPIEFDAQTNCQWKYSIKGEGHASPIVIGKQIFLAVAHLEAKTRSLVSLDRQTGIELWSTALHQGPFMSSHGKNSQASATPACDGELVFTAFMFDNGIHVSAVDRSGDIAWQTRAGDFTSRHGFGSSPVLYRSLVIVAGDNPGSGFITALDRSTGKIVWRINRVNESSYATPVIGKIDGQDQLLVSGCGRVFGYDPVTGAEIWSSKGPAQTTANTVVTDGRLVFAGGGYPEKRFFCIRPGTGELKWKLNLKSYVPSPMLLGDSVIIPQDNGILSSFEKTTGRENWKIRLGQDLSGSAVAHQSTLYIGGERGTLFVVEVARKPRIIAKNRLDGRIMATPAICGGQVFVRTESSLFCFANPTIENSN